MRLVGWQLSAAGFVMSAGETSGALSVIFRTPLADQGAPWCTFRVALVAASFCHIFAPFGLR